MARVRFTADHDYRPAPRVVVAFKAGSAYTVKRECADEAVALGKAVEIGAPSREDKQKPVMRPLRPRKAKVQHARGG